MSYLITVEPTGEEFEVEEDQTILDAALRNGVWLPFACGHGTCGTCKTQVLEGEVDLGDASPFALMDIEREEGIVLVCCAKPESDLTIEADIDVDPDFLGCQVEDFAGRVTEINSLSPTIKQLFIELDKPIVFQAGQYININIPNVGNRSFSLANPPQDNKLIELHIREVPGGAGTRYLHQDLTVNDELEVSGPFGQFFVRKSDDKDIIFIAGGSGLSSPLSMTLDLLAEGDRRKIYIFQGARNLEELYHHELLEGLADKNENVFYIPAINEITDADEYTGFVGMVNDAVNEYFNGKMENHKAYLCGPPPMIDASITTLMQGRVFENDIHMEKFLTALDGTKEQRRSALFKRI